MTRWCTSAVIGIALAAPSLASADDGERSVALSAASAALEANAFGTSGSSVAYGGGLRVAYGVSDAISLGLDARHLRSADVAFPAPETDAVAGESVSVYANQASYDLAFGARFAPRRALPLFARLFPFVELQAGAAVHLFSDAAAFTNAGTPLAAMVAAESSMVLSARGGVGLGYRLADRWLLSLAGHAERGTSGYRATSASLDLAWHTYSFL